MTHDELLAKIDKPYFFTEMITESKIEIDKKIAALRAVVELHKPRKESISGDCNECLNYFDSAEYPCPTIQAIEKELE
jgi:hypothetical protein